MKLLSLELDDLDSCVASRVASKRFDENTTQILKLKSRVPSLERDRVLDFGI
jgi:hypothetical protein